MWVLEYKVGNTAIYVAYEGTALTQREALKFETQESALAEKEKRPKLFDFQAVRIELEEERERYL